MKIKKYNLRLIVCAVCIFHVLFVKINYSYFQDYRRIRLYMLLLSGILLFQVVKVLLEKKWGIVNLLTVLFSASIIYSSYYNRGFESSNIQTSFILGFGIFELFWLLEYAKKMKAVDTVLRVWWICILIYCALSDILWIMNPHVYGQADTFLIGNKFQICYMHIWLLILYFNFEKKKRALIVVLFLLNIIVAINASCTTALIGCISLGILLKFRMKLETVIRNPATLAISLAFFNSILMVNSALTANPTVRYIIVNILGKDPTLTGRVGIYAKALIAIKNSLLWGYGYENNYTASVRYIGAANIQNGILDLVMSYGVIGTILLIGLLLYLIYQKGNETSYIVISALYMYVLISSVEIVFDGWFFACVALVAFWSDNNIGSDYRINNEEAVTNQWETMQQKV